MTKFHKDRAKIIDFLSLVIFELSRKFSSSVSNSYIFLNYFVNFVSKLFTSTYCTGTFSHFHKWKTDHDFLFAPKVKVTKYFFKWNLESKWSILRSCFEYQIELKPKKRTCHREFLDTFLVRYVWEDERQIIRGRYFS